MAHPIFRPVFLASLALLLSLFAPPALAHPTGVSKIDFYLDGDTVQALVDVNRNDLHYSLSLTNLDILPKEEFKLINDRIALYFESRIPVNFDKPKQGGVMVLHWNKLSKDPQARMDSLALMDTSIAMRLGWLKPAGAQWMDVQIKLFAELQVQPLSHVKVHWKGKVIHRRFLTLDGRMSLPLVPDSLDAMAAAQARSDSGAGPAAGSGGGAVSGDEESVFGRFLKLGFLHILPHGLDHILFVLGLFFFSTQLRPLLIQVTAFTIAHSITLALSLVGAFSLPSSVVEPLIALSIAVVALENIFFRKLRPSRWVLVFGFGLIHGMGFAGVLRGLGLPEGQFLTTLVGFNLGVELGQLAVIALAVAATFWAWRKPWYFRFIVIPVSAAIALVGLFWTVQRIVAG
jgi:hypothetical protein